MIPKDDQLGACMRLLNELQERQASCAEALEGLAQLRAEMPEARVDLVWDTETIGDGVTYAVLLSIDGWTYSLGAVRQGSMPWPLRGATDPRAERLLTVEGVTITVAQAIGLLDFVWRTKSIADKLVDMALLAKEDARHEVEATRDEIVSALLRLRTERGLRDEGAYRAWLGERGITDEQLRAWVGGVLVHRRLEQRIVNGRIESELEARPGDYMRARVASFEIHDGQREQARSLITEGRDVIDVANALGGASGSRSIELTDVFRYEAPVAFDVLPGATVLVEGHGTLRVVKVLDRELDPPADALRNRAAKRLVAEHFRKLRAHAEIEWHWGKVDVPGTTFSNGVP